MKKSSSDPKPKSGDELVEKKKEVKKRVKKQDKEVVSTLASKDTAKPTPKEKSVEKPVKPIVSNLALGKATDKPVKPKKAASNKVVEKVKVKTPEQTSEVKPKTNVKPKPTTALSQLPNYLDDPLIQKPNMRLMEQKVSESYQLMLDYLSFKGPLSFVFETYENWITNILPRQIKATQIPLKDGTHLEFEFEFAAKPVYKDKNGKEKPLYPRTAMLENHNYVSQLFITVFHFKEDRLIAKKTGVPFFEIGAMVNSVLCHLRDMSPEEKLLVGSDPNDAGGYFIFVPGIKQMQDARKAKAVYILSIDGMMKDQNQLFKEKEIVSKITISTTKGTQQITVVCDKHNILNTRCGLKQDPNTKKQRTVNVLILYYILDKISKVEFNLEETIKMIVSLTKAEYRHDMQIALAPTIGNFMTFQNPIQFFSEQLGVGNKALLEEESMNHVNNVVFPTTSDYHYRKIELSMLVVRLLEYMIGKRKMDDRDHWGNKKIVTAGSHIQTLFNTLLIRVVRDIKSTLEQRTIDIGNIERCCITAFREHLTANFHASFTSAHWGPTNSRRASAQYVEPMPTDGTIITLWSLISGIKKPIHSQGKVEVKVRHIKDNSQGYAGLEDSPEGKTIGIKLYFALLASVSLEWDPSLILTFINNSELLQVKKNFDPIYNTKIVLNGIFLGWGRGLLMEVNLRQMKRKGIIPRDVRIFYEDRDDTLYLDCNGGRPVRPLLVVENGELLIDKLNLWKKPMTDIIDSGAMEMVDALEQSRRDYLVSYSVDNLRNRQKINADLKSRLEMIRSGTYTSQNIPNYSGYFDLQNKEGVENTINNLEQMIQKDDYEINFGYCEINPNALLSYTGAVAAFGERNPIPRLTYQANMGRQAVGRTSVVQNLIFDRSTMEIMPTGSFTSTPLEHFIGQTEHSPHQPVMMLVQPTPDNQEDSIELNGSSVDRGLFRYDEYYSTIAVESSTGNNMQKKIYKPNLEDISEVKRTLYRNLDNDGIVRVGSIVSDGDILISMYRKTDTERRDIPEKVRKGEGGQVDAVHQTTDSTGNRIVMVKVRQNRIPIVGDKFQMGNAQKGTVGRIQRGENMPFVISGPPEMIGMVPDVIINPHAFPSRMTMGVFIEMTANLIGIETGTIIDVSSFQEAFTIERLLSVAKRLGWHHRGYVRMASGITGRPYGIQRDTNVQMKPEELKGLPAGSGLMFMLPISYRQLKHVTHKKMHARGIGAKRMDTRQPVGGRQRDGAPRFGRMESDVFKGHGVFYNLADRLCGSSDAFESVVCTGCGNAALIDYNNKRFKCTLCKTEHANEGFGKLTTPYILTNIRFHLQSAGINAKLNITPHIEGKIYAEPYEEV